jgi:hypothetical protein
MVFVKQCVPREEVCNLEIYQWCGEPRFASATISKGGCVQQIPRRCKHKSLLIKLVFSVPRRRWLMLFRDKIAVYCENRTEDTNPLCGKNAGFKYITADYIYIYIYHNHWALKG